MTRLEKELRYFKIERLLKEADRKGEPGDINLINEMVELAIELDTGEKPKPKVN